MYLNKPWVSSIATNWRTMSSFDSVSSDTAPLRHSLGWGSTKSSECSEGDASQLKSYLLCEQGSSLDLLLCISEEDTHIHQEVSHQDLNFRIWIVVMWGLCALNFIKELEAGRHDASPISAHCGSPMKEHQQESLVGVSFKMPAAAGHGMIIKRILRKIDFQRKLMWHPFHWG